MEEEEIEDEDYEPTYRPVEPETLYTLTCMLPEVLEGMLEKAREEAYKQGLKDGVNQAKECIDKTFGSELVYKSAINQALGGLGKRMPQV